MKNKSGILYFIKERFPLHILTFTTLSSILASTSVAVESFTYWQVIIAFVITTLFLFHIRAIDEKRDFVNDSELHPDRPVQQGLVTVKKLLIISIIGIVLSLGLAYYASVPTLIIALCFVVFTTFAAFDFFVPNVFKNKPVIYHIVNSPQMILLQWLIFSVFTSSFSMTKEMWLFMLLIYNNIFILELVRKIKAPENDTEDSYTANLGLKKSILFLVFLVLTGFVLYYLIINRMGIQQILTYLYGVLLSIFVIGMSFYFYFNPKKKIQKIMELSSVLFYVIMNVLIFLAK